MTYKKQSHRGAGRGFHREACRPVPSKEEYEAMFDRIRAANPLWSFARVNQRAMVEVFKEPK